MRPASSCRRRAARPRARRRARPLDALLALDLANGLDDLLAHLTPSRRSGSPARSRRTESSVVVDLHSALVSQTRPRRCSCRRPSVRSFTRRPTAPAKCSGLRSGRSIPGDETSTVYSREVVAQRVGDALAERVVDAVGMVDEDGEAVRALQLDREHLDAVEAAFDALAISRCSCFSFCRTSATNTRSCHKKWARRPISPNR